MADATKSIVGRVTRNNDVRSTWPHNLSRSQKPITRLLSVLLPFSSASFQSCLSPLSPVSRVSHPSLKLLPSLFTHVAIYCINKLPSSHLRLLVSTRTTLHGLAFSPRFPRDFVRSDLSCANRDLFSRATSLEELSILSYRVLY